MKKSLLALAVAAFASSSVMAANVYDKDGTSMDIYGRIQAVYYSHNSGANNNDANDGNVVGSGRLGLDLRTQLTDGIAGFAHAEWNMADSDGYDTFDSRYLWVGVDFGPYGMVKAGKFEDAVKYVVEVTDIFDDWGCVGQLGNDDRRNGMIGYYWSGYGLDVNVTFGTAKDGQQVDGAFLAEAIYDENGLLVDFDSESADIKYSYAASVGYTTPDVLFGPISIRAGFGGAEFQGRNDGAYKIGGEDAYLGNFYDSYYQWAASVSWGKLNDGLYLGLTANARHFDLYENFLASEYDVTGVEFVVSYGFANGVTASIGYEWMNIDYEFTSFIKSTLNPSDDSNAYVIPVYVTYQVNPNFLLWLEARFDAGTDDGDRDNFELFSNGVYSYDENIFSIGARYTF